jgi:uncharacterized protein (DUF433 family)
VVARSLSEAEKMRRVPGIVYVDGPVGRRAHVEGTGLDVFEIIKVYQCVAGDTAKLAAVYDWLTPAQLQVAIEFYRLFPAEIDERLERECRVWQKRFGASA